MQNKINKDSLEKLFIQYLKKNKNFFLNKSYLLKQLDFPYEIKHSSKIVDLNIYRSNKIKNDYEKIKKQMSEMLKAGTSHFVSQKRILKTSLKILNSKSLEKLMYIIVNDLGSLLACDVVNCYSTSNKIKYNGINHIDNKIVSNFFKDKPQTYLNQNPKGIAIFFPNKSRIIKSYLLMKIIHSSDRFILAVGSKNQDKFTKDQQVDLIEYLIQVTEIRLTQLIN